jgi:hypothetical protein
MLVPQRNRGSESACLRAVVGLGLRKQFSKGTLSAIDAELCLRQRGGPKEPQPLAEAGSMWAGDLHLSAQSLGAGMVMGTPSVIR